MGAVRVDTTLFEVGTSDSRCKFTFASFGSTFRNAHETEIKNVSSCVLGKSIARIASTESA